MLISSFGFWLLIKNIIFKKIIYIINVYKNSILVHFCRKQKYLKSTGHAEWPWFFSVNLCVVVVVFLSDYKYVSAMDIIYSLLLYIRRLWFIKRQKSALLMLYGTIQSSRFIHYIILNCPNDPGIPVTLNAHLQLNHCIFRPPEGLLIWLLAWYLNYNIIQPEQLLSGLWDCSHAFWKFGGAVTKLGLCLLNLLPYGYFKIHNLIVTDPTCLMNDNP